MGKFVGRDKGDTSLPVRGTVSQRLPFPRRPALSRCIEKYCRSHELVKRYAGTHFPPRMKPCISG